MSILERMNEYNALLKRLNKAETYFDDPDLSDEKKDSWKVAYQRLAMEADRILRKIPDYTSVEVILGFDIKKHNSTKSAKRYV